MIMILNLIKIRELSNSIRSNISRNLDLTIEEHTSYYIIQPVMNDFILLMRTVYIIFSFISV